jgi:hypothetical protein
VVLLKDVGRAELGAENYNTNLKFNTSFKVDGLVGVEEGVSAGA